MPFLRIGLRKPELRLRWSLRLRAIPCTVPCQGIHFPTIRASHHPFDLEPAISLSRDCFVKKNWDNCRAARRGLLKNSSRVVFRSQNGRQHAAPESGPPRNEGATRKTPTMHRERPRSAGRAGAFKESFNRLGIKVP
jgi:hypothetical protein